MMQTWTNREAEKQFLCRLSCDVNYVDDKEEFLVETMISKLGIEILIFKLQSSLFEFENKNPNSQLGNDQIIHCLDKLFFLVVK